MTTPEAIVYNNKNLVEVQMVVDCSAELSAVIKQLTAAITATDHDFFAKRWKHWCEGGLVTMQEQRDFVRVLEEQCRKLGVCPCEP